MNISKAFYMPPTVLYLKNSFAKVGEQAALHGKKALIVSDGIMDSLGFIDSCREYLTVCGIGHSVYTGVVSEPTDCFVEEALAQFRSEQCDIIISLGGGSCIDTAKAVAVLAANGGDISEYMGGKRIADQPPVPHIAVPTTAGTGSEVTDATVITNSSDHVKMMIKQFAFMPSAAIVDPLLTISSPKQVTAATGVDALSHAIEAYISNKAHPMTDIMALSAIRLIAQNLQDAYDNGQNISARENMSLAALQAGIAFSNASVCLVHGMSRPIGALFHVPHGFSNAMLLPAILEYSKDACIERLADVGRIFSGNSQLPDEEAAEAAVQAVKQLCQSLGIPNLEKWGINEQEFENAISKMSHDALNSGSPGNNPKVPEKEQIEDLYRVCYGYQF